MFPTYHADAHRKFDELKKVKMNLLCTSRRMFISDDEEKEFHKDLKESKSFEDRINLATKLFEKNDMVNKFQLAMNIPKKDATISFECRNIASELYHESIKPQGLRLTIPNYFADISWIYSRCLRFAPAESKELAFAYANRSAFMLGCKLYDSCLNDIEKALVRYPDHQKAKLYARQAQCLIKLNASKSEIEKSLESTQQFFKKMNKNDKSRYMVENIIKDSSNEKNYPRVSRLRALERKSLIFTDNSDSIDDAIEIQHSEENGNRFVAKRDINPGEMLSLRKSYSSIESFQQCYDYCFYCQEQILVSVPCDKCVTANYCSEECKSLAWSSHHDIECQIIDLIAAFAPRDIESILYCLKAFIQFFKELGGNFTTLRAKIESTNTKNDLKIKRNEDVFDGLESVSEKSSDEIDLTITCAYVAYLLATKTKIFGDEMNSELKTLKDNNLVLFMGGFLIKHSMQSRPNEIFKFEKKSVLCCLDECPLKKMLPHSCCPNVTNVFDCHSCIIYSIDSIKKGDLLFADNGFHFMKDLKIVRNMFVRTGLSECDCLACREDWPVLENLPSIFKDGKLQPDVLNKLRSEYNKVNGKVDFTKEHSKADFKPGHCAEVAQLIKLFNEHVSFPVREKYQAIEYLKSIYE